MHPDRHSIHLVHPGRISHLARRDNLSRLARVLLDRVKVLALLPDRAALRLALGRPVSSLKARRSQLARTHRTSNPGQTQGRSLPALVILEDRSRPTLVRPSSLVLGLRLVLGRLDLRILDKDLGRGSRLDSLDLEDRVRLDRRGELCRMGCQSGHRDHRQCRDREVLGDQEAQDRGREDRLALARRLRV